MSYFAFLGYLRVLAAIGGTGICFLIVMSCIGIVIDLFGPEQD